MRPILHCPSGLKRASIPVKLAICCRRVLGYHPLLGCSEEQLGGMWSHLKQVVMDEIVAYYRPSSTGPKNYSLDYRAKACYFLCSL